MIIPEEETQKYFGEITEEPESIDFSQKWAVDYISYLNMTKNLESLNIFLKWAEISENEFKQLTLEQFSDMLEQFNKDQKKTVKPDLSVDFSKPLIPMCYGVAYNGFFMASRENIQNDGRIIVDISAKTQMELTLERISELYAPTSNNAKGVLYTSAKKLFDTFMFILSRQNACGVFDDIPNNEVPLNVIDYATALGIDFTPKDFTKTEIQRADQRRKDFKRQMQDDIKHIKHITDWDGTQLKNGRKIPFIDNRSDYGIIAFQKYNKLTQTFHVQFSNDFVKYMLNSYICDFPLNLLKSKNPYTYDIGRKMVMHYCMFPNKNANRENHLKVHSLLNATPDISTIEEYSKTGRKDWKTRVKGKLEKGLNELITLGVLESWIYLKQGKEITSEEAKKCTMIEYDHLIVDFEFLNRPDRDNEFIKWKELKRLKEIDKKKSKK